MVQGLITKSPFNAGNNVSNENLSLSDLNDETKSLSSDISDNYIKEINE